MMKFTTTLCALACVSAGPLRLRGNTAGRQRKLLDFSFSPSLSGSDSVSTGNMVRGSINQMTVHGEGNTANRQLYWRGRKLQDITIDNTIGSQGAVVGGIHYGHCTGTLSASHDGVTCNGVPMVAEGRASEKEEMAEAKHHRPKAHTHHNSHGNTKCWTIHNAEDCHGTFYGNPCRWVRYAGCLAM